MWASPAVNNFNCTMILMYTGINRLYRCALSEEIDVRVNKYSNISFVRKSLTHQRLYLYQWCAREKFERILIHFVFT